MYPGRYCGFYLYIAPAHPRKPEQIPSPGNGLSAAAPVRSRPWRLCEPAGEWRRVSPQTTAVSRSDTSPASPLRFHCCGEPAAHSRSVIPNSVQWSPVIFERMKTARTSQNPRKSRKESSVYLDEGYINVIYPLWLSVCVCPGTHGRIVGCFICAWFLLEHQRPGQLCPLQKNPTHPDECI